MQAQTSDTATLQQLVSVALEKNYGILIANNNSEISKINNSLGNAGFLPKIDVGISNLYSQSDNRTDYFDGTTTQSNVNNSLLDALVQLNWTVFDGTAMFIRKNRLSEFENQNAVRLEAEIENVYFDLAIQYFELVQQQKLMQVLEYTMNISRFRLNLAELKFRLGAASEIDKIQASLDLNNDSSLLLKQDILIKNLKADINNTLGRVPEFQFSAEKEITMSEELNFEQIQQSFSQQNKDILLSESNLKLKELIYRETKTVFLPELSLYADYEYYNSHNSAGSMKLNTVAGPSVGVKLSYTVFDGFNSNRKRQIAKVDLSTAQIETDENLNTVRTILYQTYNNYKGALTLADLETGNLSDARKNLQLAVEMYKRGTIGEIEFREIQRKEFESESRFLSAQFAAKSAELQLLKLIGQLNLK